MAKKKLRQPVGRPTKYKVEYSEMLISHMKDGLSYESFGGIADVSKQTLYDWEAVHPEFLDSKRRGESHARLYWEKVGKDGLYNETIKTDDGMTVNRSINSSIWSLHMKNRFGWRDKHEVVAEVTTNDQSKQVKELYEQLKAVRELK